MKAVGIKQLKAHLSQYIREVRGGETVLVTDRDEVVAEIRPAHRQPRPAESIDEILDRLAEEGQVTRASVPKGNWVPKFKGAGLPSEEVDKILDELRKDSREE